MAGFFSGLGSKGKTADTNTAKPSTTEDEAAKQTSLNKDQITTNVKTETELSHLHDRSNKMRLSKSTPAKAEEDFDIPSDTVIPSFSSSTVGKSTTSEVRSTAPSAVIGPKITFKGELTGEEDLLIEGKIEGTIELKNNHLTIGKQGSVRANVVAKSITIEGGVEGDLFAAERVSIKSSSNVKGNVTADRVTLEDGAKFRGSIDMDSKNSANKTTPKLSSSESAEKA